MFGVPVVDPEGMDFDAVATEAGEVTSFGGIPLVVVTRGQPDDLGFPAAAEAVWLELQAELLGLSTNSVQLIAENSGHAVPIEQPDIIVEAIQLLLDGRVDSP